MQCELRNGSLFASNGYVYRDRNPLFIEESQWQRERSTWHRQLNLPVSFAHYQRRLSSALSRGLNVLAGAVANGELPLDQDGIHVKHLAGEHEEPIVSKIRKAIFREIGDVQLPDMIISIDQRTRICSALLGRKQHAKKELLSVYGAITVALSICLSISSTELSLSPDITASRIS